MSSRRRRAGFRGGPTGLRAVRQPSPAQNRGSDAGLGNRSLGQLFRSARGRAVVPDLLPLNNQATGELIGSSGQHPPIMVHRSDAATGTPPAPAEEPAMIKWGSQGPDVEHAQQRLNAHGAAPALAVDGIFGPLTNKATRRYQRGHGLAVDGIVGPRTWASLDGPTNVGDTAGSGSGGSGGPGSSVLLYDTTAQTFNAPASGTTMTSIRTAIKAKQDLRPDPELGTTVSVTGVTHGSRAELFLWNVLLQRAERRFWGGEIDVITEIGPVPTTGGTAPMGKVTVKIDGAGNAEASLEGAGAVAAPTGFPTRADAIAALKGDFGFTDVKNGTATWTLEELNKVHAALTKLPAADRGQLGGCDLIRDSTLFSDAGEALAGKFQFSASVTAGGPGTTASASRSQALHLADDAFAHDAVSFVGDASGASGASAHTILHEAAHAIESKDFRDAQFATLEAQAMNNNDIAAQNVANTEMGDAINDANASTRSARGSARGYSAADRTSARPFIRAHSGVIARLNTFGRSTAVARLPAQETAADTAIANRNTTFAALPAAHPARTDFAASNGHQDIWFAKAKVRAAAVVHADASRTDLAAKKAAEATVSDTAGTGSKRVEEFVTFVNANGIPPLTEYAKKNWPNEPGEFFAEAYSLWLADPAYLNSQAPALKTWFDDGNHL